MKCKVIRKDLESAPSCPIELTHMTNVVIHGRTVERRCIIEGTVIDHPQAYMLVKQGVAVPADEECAVAAGLSGQQMGAAQRAYERVSRGIHPSDYDKFDAGVIAGYNPDGTYIPGPNWVEEDDGPLSEDDDPVE